MEAFVYCWTDHKTGKLYVGSHKGSVYDKYVCSSKPMLEEYIERPDDFTRQIIAEGEYRDIRKLESVILKSCNAALNESFYNKNNGDGKFYCSSHNDKSRQKISNSLSGGKRTEESKKNISKALKGRTIPEEVKLKMSISAKKRADSIRGREHLQSIAKLGTPARKLLEGSFDHTEETKQYLSEITKKMWNDGVFTHKKKIGRP